MYSRSEGFFTGASNNKIFFQIWKKENARGTILITHGQGEHSECYTRLIEGLSDLNVNFYVWDLRGHGRSEGRRGFVKDFDEYCEDFRIFVKKVRLGLDESVKNKPFVLLSHSMGGLIQLKSLLKFSEIQADALVFSAPFLGLSVPVPAYKEKAAFIFNSFLPQITMGNEIRNEMLTRDPDVIREYEQDALRHTRVSPGAFIGFLDSFEFVLPRASDFKIKSLFQIPADDPVVSSPVTQSFFERYGAHDKKMIIYDGARHELYNDINRQEVYTDLKEFLSTVLEQQK